MQTPWRSAAFLACSLWLVQLSFLYNLDPPAQGMGLSTVGLDPPASISKQSRKCFTNMATGQSDLENSLVDASSSHVMTFVSSRQLKLTVAGGSDF